LHPEEGEFLIFNEVLLPYDVATSPQKIISTQIEGTVEKPKKSAGRNPFLPEFRRERVPDGA
jgi:hypothetical protein